MGKQTLTADDLEKVRLILEAPVAETPQEGRWPVLLNTVGIVPVVSNLPSVSSSLLAKQHGQTMLQVAKYSLPVRFMGYAPAFKGTRLYQGDESDWAVMSLTNDPLYYASGKKVILPQAIMTDVKRVFDADINFDAVFIAHEIPKGSAKVGEQISLELIMPPPPPHLTRRLRKLEQMNEAFWLGLAKGALLTAKTVAVAAIATPLAVGAVASMAFSAASLDPVLFGLYLDRSQKVNGEYLAMWYYISHWYWPSENEV